MIYILLSILLVVGTFIIAYRVCIKPIVPVHEQWATLEATEEDSRQHLDVLDNGAL
jgi:hypothetical protein